MRVVNHVIAGVAILRDGLVATQELGITRIEGGGKDVELVAGIVDVELALHGVARSFQHVGQRVADCGVARAAIVQRAGGVGAHILDLPVLAAALVDVAKAAAGLDDLRHLAAQPLIGQKDVDEARPGNLDAADGAIDRQVIGDGLGDGARVDIAAGLARRCAGDHRDIRAVVTMPRLLGA